MNAPPITVAVPTYNGAQHIEAAVRSVLSQGDIAFDFIVCDDRSNDDTVERVKVLAGDRVQVHVHSERLGLAGNWNRCVELARTPLVSVFHQDDVMLPGHLRLHVNAFGPETGLVASAVQMTDDAGVPFPPGLVESGGCGAEMRKFRPGEFLRELAVLNPLRCSAVTMRRSAHLATGGFRAEYRYVVDWAHWIELAKRFEAIWLPETTVQMRWHKASETHRFSGGTIDLEESARLLETLYQGHPELADARPKAMKRLARGYLNRAYVAAQARNSKLSRASLRRAISLSPMLILKVLADPRLCARLAIGQLGGQRGEKVSTARAR